MTKAWYHISTLQDAMAKQEARFDELVAEAQAKWDAANEVGWRWDSWFSLPRKRKLTVEEACWSDYYKDRKYRWLLPYTRTWTFRSQKSYIDMARRSEGNLVLLDSYQVKDFDGYLTTPTEPENPILLIEG